MRHEDEEDWFYTETFTKKSDAQESHITIYADKDRMRENFYALSCLDIPAQNYIEDRLWVNPRKGTYSMGITIEEPNQDISSKRANHAAKICNRWDTTGWQWQEKK